MKRLLPFLLLTLLIFSCKSKKTASSTKRQSHTIKVNTTAKPSAEAETIVKYAKTFDGTRYKYGGTTKRGMDCSGLIYTSFKEYNVSLPRSTSGLKSAGNWIDLKEVNVGDLVFFATNKNSRNVNHVGIVTNVRVGNVEFIHASSSRGVMTSSLAESIGTSHLCKLDAYCKTQFLILVTQYHEVTKFYHNKINHLFGGWNSISSFFSFGFQNCFVPFNRISDCTRYLLVTTEIQNQQVSYFCNTCIRVYDRNRNYSL